MYYDIATEAQIVAHFETVTRQRIQQILKKYLLEGNDQIVTKIINAKAILKRRKYVRKNGCSLKDKAKCDTIWGFLVRRVGKVTAYFDCVNNFESSEHFRLWALTQVGFNCDGFELDKDILIKGNRAYGPDTCVFVPQELNGLFAGCYKAKKRGTHPIGVCFNKGSGSFVAQMNDRQGKGYDKYLGSFPTVEEAFACYKAAKEAKIKRLAEKWKDRIEPRAYEALMNRTVEWND